ncbi:MAG: flagellar export protein FliJ [Phycisphaerales bacterium JB058]|jgi:flagellar export protein FliJ
MARFRFRLQPVLRQRELAERDEQLVVAEIERDRMRLEERLRGMQQEIDGEQDELNQIIGNGSVNPMHARAQSAAILAKRAQAQRVAKELALVYKRLEKARGELAQAAMRRRSMELLRDNQLAAFRREQSQAEDRVLDELAVMRATRQGENP